jgi:Cys-rich protein (TIGR01571 family)
MAHFDEALFGCMRSKRETLIICLVPCAACYYQSKATSEVTANSRTSTFLWPFLGLCIGAGYNRKRIREAFLLQGNMWSDTFIHLFCSSCAVTQEIREVRRRVEENKTMFSLEHFDSFSKL